MTRVRACPGTGVEVAVAAATALGAGALARLVSSGGTDTVAAFVATSLVGFAVAALLHRTRVSVAIGAVVTTVAVTVVATWFAALDAAGGFPTGAAFGALPGDLRAARSQLAAFTVPLHAGAGLVLVGSVLCGMAGLVAHLLLGPFGRPTPRSHPALALLPALALVVWSCLARPGSSAAAVCGVLALAAVAALALPSEPGAADRPFGQRWVVGAVVAALVAVGATVGVGLPLGGASTAPSSASSVVSLSLTTGLLTVERQDANDVLFRAHSSIPTYWQVAVLTQWRNNHWVVGPDDSDPTDPTAVGRGLLPSSSDAHRTGVSVTVAGWSSRLLPVPPSVVSVTTAGAVVNADGVVAPQATVRTTSYRASAVALTLSPGTTGTLSGLDPATQSALTALPSVPASVRDAAMAVTEAASTPLGRAEELVNWLRAGTFTYTLTPPAPAPGTNPLVDFLFASRSGSCESFAGAFAVMARLVGLPTRVAVGFTSGKLAADGSYVVTGADAHAWPEVYLGRALGWVSFEPTPEQASGSIAPPDVVGTSATSVAPPPVTTFLAPPSTSTPTSQNVAPSRVAPTTSHPLRQGGPHNVHHHTPASTGWWWLLLGLFAAACVAAGAVLRRRRRSQAAAEERVVNAYRRAERALRRAGLVRPTWCTPVAHAAWLLASADRWRSLGQGPGGDQLRAALVDLGTLANVVERAGYDPVPTTPAEVRTAEEAAARVRRTFSRPSVRRLARNLDVPSPRTTMPASR